MDLLLESRISQTLHRANGHCETAYELSRMPEPPEPMHSCIGAYGLLQCTIGDSRCTSPAAAHDRGLPGVLG